ncbi:RyR domain-containing protein [uncultured Adlercreutzia sp.]|uniref:RyR domain-containing protein n=1 Tax=uncultured Adlercreutzia sp. TaxID=875803 RepID=UPI0025D6CD57|nr:RyR domain-containing protein [uncultured Adlercreutzia sp.]
MFGTSQIHGCAAWHYGATKDVENRLSPYLVPWEELPDRAKEWNRSAVRSIPNLLASVNLAVVK